jgi:hypothetical protein
MKPDLFINNFLIAGVCFIYKAISSRDDPAMQNLHKILTHRRNFPESDSRSEHPVKPADSFTFPNTFHSALVEE